jgi:hypothetical protein
VVWLPTNAKPTQSLADRIECGQGALEIGNRFSLALRMARFDLPKKHVAPPAVLVGRPGTPDSFFRQRQLFEYCEVVIPRNVREDRLHNCLITRSRDKGTHVFESARRQSFGSGKALLETRCETIDNFLAAALLFLTVEDIAASLPLEQHQVLVYSQGCTELRRWNPALQVCERLTVPIPADGSLCSTRVPRCTASTECRINRQWKSSRSTRA